MRSTPDLGAQAEPQPALALVAHDSRPHLERFLEGQLAAAEDLGTELVVVDNASRDGGRELVEAAAAASPALRLVANGVNRGYAAGVNAAFAATAPRDVFLINPDVELGDGAAVRRLAEIARERPRAAVVAPRLVGAGGEAQPSARRYPSAGTMLATLPSLRRLPAAQRAYERYTAPSRGGRITPVDWVIGAAMLIRRRAFDVLGGWDERFFLYMEDADFCRRCNRSGWEVAYAPEVVLRHGYARASSSARSALRSRARRRHLVSLARFFALEPRLLVGGGRRADG